MWKAFKDSLDFNFIIIVIVRYLMVYIILLNNERKMITRFCIF
jgi:hypothetical protein